MTFFDAVETLPPLGLKVTLIPILYSPYSVVALVTEVDWNRFLYSASLYHPLNTFPSVADGSGRRIAWDETENPLLLLTLNVTAALLELRSHLFQPLLDALLFKLVTAVDTADAEEGDPVMLGAEP